MSKQTQETNKKIAERLAEEVFSKGKMEAFDEIFADNYVMRNMPVPNIPGTKEGFRKLVLATRLFLIFSAIPQKYPAVLFTASTISAII